MREASSRSGALRPRGLVLAYLVAVTCAFVGLGIGLRASPGPAATLLQAVTLDVGHLASRPWSALTYLFFHAPEQPVQLVFGLLCVYAFGPELEASWSRARLVGLVVAVAVAGVAAVALVRGLGGPADPATGGASVASALLVAWCVGNRDRRLQVWMVSVTGLQLLLVALALQAWELFSGPSASAVAQLAAVGVGASFADRTPLRGAILRARLRRVDARRKALRVLPGGRPRGPRDQLN